MLGYRFPIGVEEQIKKNATLFIVGDIGSVSRTIEMIEVRQTLLVFMLVFSSSPPSSSSSSS
jgi:hypothetical protein